MNADKKPTCETCRWFYRLYVEVNLGACANGRNQIMRNERAYLLAVHGHDKCKYFEHTPKDQENANG